MIKFNASHRSGEKSKCMRCQDKTLIRMSVIRANNKKKAYE